MGTRKVLLLDLDETLIRLQNSSVEEFNKIRKDPSNMDIRRNLFVLDFVDQDDDGNWERVQLWAIKRPHLDQFLRFAFDYFSLIIIWSAGVSRYVKSIVKELFKDYPQPPIIYTRSDQKDNSGNKPLEQMIQEIPEMKTIGSLKNILVVDDKKYTFEKNPENGIHIPVYKPKDLRQEDTALLDLMDWLNTSTVQNATDVRKLDKKNIFK